MGVSVLEDFDLLREDDHYTVDSFAYFNSKQFLNREAVCELGLYISFLEVVNKDSVVVSKEKRSAYHAKR